GQLLHGESALQQALHHIEKEGAGLLLLLRNVAAPTGLVTEIKALCGEKSQSEMDSRDYGIGAQILRAVGAHKIRLLSNHVEKRVGLKAYDLEIVELVCLKEDGYGEEDCIEEDGDQQNQNRSGHVTIQ
ncbi:MAG: GTP cyclohydrolase II, partial [Pseudobdellovibrionaceae bacterium]